MRFPDTNIDPFEVAKAARAYAKALDDRKREYEHVASSIKTEAESFYGGLSVFVGYADMGGRIGCNKGSDLAGSLNYFERTLSYRFHKHILILTISQPVMNDDGVCIEEVDEKKFVGRRKEGTESDPNARIYWAQSFDSEDGAVAGELAIRSVKWLISSTPVPD